MAGRQMASKTEKEPREIKLAHSPDSDDAFMFYALATHKLSTPGYKYTHTLSDIQSLNEAALDGNLRRYGGELCRLSFAAGQIRSAGLRREFWRRLRPDRRGDQVRMKPQDLKGKRIGVPGLKTTAYLTLKLFEPDFEAVVMPFDKIIEAVGQKWSRRDC